MQWDSMHAQEEGRGVSTPAAAGISESALAGYVRTWPDMGKEFGAVGNALFLLADDGADVHFVRCDKSDFGISSRSGF
jgi:hypothetical protein